MVPADDAASNFEEWMMARRSKRTRRRLKGRSQEVASLSDRF